MRLEEAWTRAAPACLAASRVHQAEIFAAASRRPGSCPFPGSWFRLMADVMTLQLRLGAPRRPATSQRLRSSRDGGRAADGATKGGLTWAASVCRATPAGCRGRTGATFKSKIAIQRQTLVGESHDSPHDGLSRRMALRGSNPSSYTTMASDGIEPPWCGFWWDRCGTAPSCSATC